MEDNKEQQAFMEYLAKVLKATDQQDFERKKKKLNGDYDVEYNEVANIGRMLAADYVKGINSFEYMDKFEEIDAEYAKQVLKEIFTEDKMIMSVIKGKK